MCVIRSQSGLDADIIHLPHRDIGCDSQQVSRKPCAVLYVCNDKK